jgi:hypothetical protein
MKYKNLRHIIFFVAVIAFYRISIRLTNDFNNTTLFYFGVIIGYWLYEVAKKLIEE